MENRNGMDYAQNYDLIVKLMGDLFKGRTLDVIGVKSGRIEEVFGFEPADISVRAGRVDLMLRDDQGEIFHIEEQRNLQKKDMHRFAAYHFMAAYEWSGRITDVILASGDVYPGEKTLVTHSGRYTPAVIDFTQRDARKRLKEIREAVSNECFDNWLELIFLPLYGKETGKARSDIAEQVIDFETELLQQDKISVRLLAATFVMANKLIGKDRINELWEKIKMLDIIDVAREKGLEEGIIKGKLLGIQEGKTLGVIEATRKMLMDALFEKYGVIPPRISDKVKRIDNQDTLESLFRQVFRCENRAAFEEILDGLDL